MTLGDAPYPLDASGTRRLRRGAADKTRCTSTVVVVGVDNNDGGRGEPKGGRRHLAKACYDRGAVPFFSPNTHATVVEVFAFFFWSSSLKAFLFEVPHAKTDLKRTESAIR